MNWFFLALIPPALWAATNHIDKLLISKHLKGGGVGGLLIISALMSIAVLPLIFLFHPEVTQANLTNAFILLINGAIVVSALLLYLLSLQKDDASVVVPLFQLIPVFSFLFGFLILGETLTGKQLIAFVVILFGSIIISLDLDKKFRVKHEIVWLMVLACIINAIYGVIFKKFALIEGYWPAMFWSQAGLLVAGLIIFSTVKLFRRDFIALLKQNSKTIISLNLLNEVINIAAVLISGYTLLLAPVAIISVVGGFQAVFVFVFGIILTIFFPHISQESLAKRHLVQRIIAIAIIAYGSYLLNRG